MIFDKGSMKLVIGYQACEHPRRAATVCRLIDYQIQGEMYYKVFYNNHNILLLKEYYITF